MKKLPEFPLFRSDLEIIVQPSPGKPDRCLIKDPLTNTVVEVTEKELFICKQLDGKTSLPLIKNSFFNHYGFDISIEKLETFIRQLDSQGLLVSEMKIQEVPHGWGAMKPLPFYFDRFFEKLSRILSWCFTGWFYIFFFAIFVISMFIIKQYWKYIIYNIQNLFNKIIQGNINGLVFEQVIRIILVFIFMPLVRELWKGIACRHYGVRVPEIRYTMFVHLIPHFASDITGIFHIKEKRQRVHVIISSFEFHLVLIFLGIIIYDIMSFSNPIKTFTIDFVFGITTSFFLNIIPIGRGDGSLLLSVWFNIKDFRERAIKIARAFLLHKPMPESLPKKQENLFKWYGIFADIFDYVLNIIVLSFTGYFLVKWLELAGALLFLLLLILRFDKNIRRFFMSIPFFRWFGMHVFKTKKVRNCIIGISIILVLIIIFLIPVHYETAGEFRIQPAEKREVRVEVSAQIESVLVEEGSWVKQGQLIAKLSKRKLQKELDESESALKREQAQLRLLELGPKPEAIAKAEQEVKLREVDLEHSTNKLKRFTELYEKGHVSDQEYEDVVKQRDADREALELAKKNLELVKSGPRPEEIEKQKAEVQRIMVQVLHIKDDLTRTDIYSPIEGQITTLYLKDKIGQMASVGDLIAIVENNKKAIARIYLPEEYLPEVKLNSPVRAIAWAYHNRVFTGKIISIAPVIIDKSEDELQQSSSEQEKGSVRNLNTPEEKIVPVLAELNNEEGLLKSEMTGYAKIEAGSKKIFSIVFGPIIRFFRVRVWSWLPF